MMNFRICKTLLLITVTAFAPATSFGNPQMKQAVLIPGSSVMFGILLIPRANYRETGVTWNRARC